MNLFEFIENFPRWIKITGVSTLAGLILLFGFLLIISQQPSGEEVVNVPTDLKQAKEEAIGELREAHEEATTNIVGNVVGTFNEAGKDISKDVKDPGVKVQIVFLMTFAGLMLALILVIAISKPFIELISAIGKAIPV